MTPDGRMVYLVLESTLEMREALCTTPKAHFLAEIVAAFPADTALSTRDAHLKRHSITKLEAAHLRADGDDRARRLVAKGQWLAGAEVTIGELLVVGDI